jgi:hypothetical protein
MRAETSTIVSVAQPPAAKCDAERRYLKAIAAVCSRTADSGDDGEVFAALTTLADMPRLLRAQRFSLRVATDKRSAT